MYCLVILLYTEEYSLLWICILLPRFLSIHFLLFLFDLITILFSQSHSPNIIVRFMRPSRVVRKRRKLHLVLQLAWFCHSERGFLLIQCHLVFTIFVVVLTFNFCALSLSLAVFRTVKMILLHLRYWLLFMISLIYLFLILFFFVSNNHLFFLGSEWAWISKSRDW